MFDTRRKKFKVTLKIQKTRCDLKSFFNSFKNTFGLTLGFYTHLSDRGI